MAWLRRSRFRNRVKAEIPTITNMDLSKPRLNKNSSGGSSTSANSSSHSSGGPLADKFVKKDLNLRINTGKDEPKKAGRRFFSFIKRKDPPVRKACFNKVASPVSDDGTIEGTVATSDMTNYSSSHSTASTPSSTDGQLHMIPMDSLLGLSTDEDDSDADLCFQNKKVKREGGLVGSLVAPRQNSEMSQLTTVSRRNSANSAEFDSAWSGPGSRNSDESRHSNGHQYSSGDSVSSTQSDKSATLNALFSLRGDLTTIPDNSFHSTVTEEASHISASMLGNSMHGNSKHGSDSGNNLDRIRENMEMNLYLRTVPMDEEDEPYRTVVPVPPPAQSPIAKKFYPRQRSFLPTVQQETLPISAMQGSDTPPPRAVTPPPAQARDRTPSPPLYESTQDKVGATYLIPLTLERDLSLEESTGSKSQLPSDLSMDQYSIVNLDVPDLQEMPEEDDENRKSLEDVLTELNDTKKEDNHHDRPGTCSSSGCNTSGCNTASSSEDMGAKIRSGLLNGSLFDSDPDSSCNNSSSKGSSTDSHPYQNHDEDVVMEDKSHTSKESYHFCNLPLELQNDHVSMRSGDSNSDSEVATASSDEDITHLEELYSDIFGDDDKDVLLHPASSSEEESDLSSGTLSMLGLFKDDKSCQSSVVSFDSSEFLEDEQGEQFDDYSSLHSRSKTSCSISMHDITTIHEENEDDIAEEDEEDMHDDLMCGIMDHDVDHRAPMLLNGELHLRRTDLVTPGSSGTFSSVTDDSYMGCMSFDSLSLVSERGNSPGGFYRKVAGGNGCKIDMSNHQDFVNIERPSMKQPFNDGYNVPSLQQPFNDESSQFTFDASQVSVGDSACSYDSFSSESVKYMVDILKEEAERRRNKIKERIASIRESTDRATHTSKYVAHRLDKGEESDSTMSGTL